MRKKSRRRLLGEDLEKCKYKAKKQDVSLRTADSLMAPQRVRGAREAHAKTAILRAQAMVLVVKTAARGSPFLQLAALGKIIPLGIPGREEKALLKGKTASTPEELWSGAHRNCRAW